MTRTLPFVNLNGTSREALVEQNQNAVTALDKALAAIRETAPHGRDYQGRGQTDSYNAARDQFTTRLCAVWAVREQFREDAEALAFETEND